MPQYLAQCDRSTDRLIEALLSALLDRAVGGCLVCLNLVDRLERFPFALAHGPRSSSLFDRMIHRVGDSTCADHALDRCMIVPVPRNSVGGVCRATAMACLMHTSFDWQTVMPALRNGDCQLIRVCGDRPRPRRKRLWWAGISSILVCPVVSPSGSLIGTVIIVWHGSVAAPEGAALIALEVAGKRTARQVAAVLDLCAQMHAPTEHAAAA